jgi:hypothetical protein
MDQNFPECQVQNYPFIPSVRLRKFAYYYHLVIEIKLALAIVNPLSGVHCNMFIAKSEPSKHLA